MIHFLESPAFALVPLVLIPAGVATYRFLLSSSGSTAADAPPPGVRFSLAEMMAGTFILLVFIGVGLWSAISLFTLTMVTAFYLMVGEIVFGLRWAGVALLVAAIGVALTNILILKGIAADDALQYSARGPEEIEILLKVVFAAFVIALLESAIVVVLGIVACILAFSSRFTRFGTMWLGMSGFVIWLAGLAAANVWIFVQASAAV